MEPTSSSAAGTVTDRERQSELALRVIKAAIVAGDFAAGVQVLEPELALKLGMSRTPVHEALVRLSDEGWIELVPRRGMRVVPLSVRDIREITEVLACLEVEAAERAAARRLDASDLAAFDEAIAAMDRALEDQDLERWNEADFRFHRLLIEASGNRHLIDTAHRFLDKANRYRTLTTAHRLPPVYSNVNHAAVVEAIRRADPQSAVEIHRAHKRRWLRELGDILGRLGLEAGAHA